MSVMKIKALKARSGSEAGQAQSAGRGRAVQGERVILPGSLGEGVEIHPHQPDPDTERPPPCLTTRPSTT